MSDETTPSALTRLVPGLTIVTLIVMIVAAIFHVLTMGRTPAPDFDRALAPEAPAFWSETAWFIKPTSDLPGGWAKPWGVDLFWNSNRVDTYPGGWNAPIDWIGAERKAETDDLWLTQLDPSIGVYAPKRRFTSSFKGASDDEKAARGLEAEDALDAYDHYMDKSQNFRGFFLGGHGDGLRQSLNLFKLRLEGSPTQLPYFGGVVLSPDEKDELPKFVTDLKECSSSAPDFPCVLDLRNIEASDVASRVFETFGNFGSWLDDNVRKPAAPLPPIETIRIAPINRPDD